MKKATPNAKMELFSAAETKLGASRVTSVRFSSPKSIILKLSAPQARAAAGSGLCPTSSHVPNDIFCEKSHVPRGLGALLH